MSSPIVFSSEPPRVEGVLQGLLALQRRVLCALFARSRARGTRRAQARHLATGERGELEAMFFLRTHGYRCIDRRWRADGLRGDLDLVAWDGDTLCFVEVKSRTKRDFAPARSGVDRDKQRMLRAMARAYRRQMPYEQRDGLRVRFDVVSVYLLGESVECELARDVFGWSEPARVTRYE